MFFSLILLLLPYSRVNTLRFLDVGQGDGMMIELKERLVITIDGGSHTIEDLGEKVILPALREGGHQSIDFAFITHLDKDHYSGILEVLKMPRKYIKHLVLPFNQKDEVEVKELVDIAKKSQTQITWMKQGDCLKGKSFQIKCLYAEEDISLDRNQRSLCLDIEIEGRHILVMGDAGVKQEERLIHLYPNYRCDILKINHHGSKTSSSLKFLKSIQPKVSIISCGRKNRYGHPHRDTLDSLLEASVTVYRTDELGEIQIGIDKKTYIRSYQDRRKVYLE